MRKQILQKVYESNWQYSRLDATAILDSLGKNRPNIELLSDQINQRVLLSSATDLKTVSCLQLQVFDKKINCKKVIEIFSADLLKHKIELIIFFSKQSQQLIKTDWLLQVLDSYYLDDDKFFYAIEYEYFDFSINDVNFENKLQIINQLDSYCIKAFEYSQYAFQKINKNNFPALIENIRLMNFVLSYQQDSKIKIKLNTVEPFIYESPSMFQKLKEQQPKKKTFNLQIDKLGIPQFQNILFSKDDLSEVIKNKIKQEQNYFEDIIRQILDKFQLSQFTIFSYQLDKDSITLNLLGRSLNSQVLFTIQKINSKELFQQKLQDQNAFIQQLKQLDVSILENSQAISTSEGLFFVEYFDLSQQIKNQKFYSISLSTDNKLPNFIFQLNQDYKDFNLRQMYIQFQNISCFGFIDISDLSNIFYDSLKVQLIQDQQSLFKENSHNSVFNYVIFSLKNKLYNENMISNFINKMFNGYKDQSDIIISKAKNLTLELIHHNYDLNNLTPKSTNINQTSKAYCMCYSRQDNTTLSQNSLIAVTVESLMHIILQELIGFNKNIFCLCSQLNKLTNSIANSQKQLTHLKFDIYICEEVRQQLNNSFNYFDLKSQSIYCLEISNFCKLNMEDQYLVYTQLKCQNKNISTLIVGKKEFSQNFQINRNKMTRIFQWYATDHYITIFKPLNIAKKIQMAQDFQLEKDHRMYEKGARVDKIYLTKLIQRVSIDSSKKIEKLILCIQKQITEVLNFQNLEAQLEQQMLLPNIKICLKECTNHIWLDITKGLRPYTYGKVNQIKNQPILEFFNYILTKQNTSKGAAQRGRNRPRQQPTR
ncbi:hypothetical protein ABPG74_018584 [Tetrahymena malaccensis]